MYLRGVFFEPLNFELRTIELWTKNHWTLNHWTWNLLRFWISEFLLKKTCSLIFSGNRETQIIKKPETGQMWVYLSAEAATFINIKHPDYGTYKYFLPERLCDYCVYEMVLQYVNNQLPPSSLGTTITIYKFALSKNRDDEWSEQAREGLTKQAKRNEWRKEIRITRYNKINYMSLMRLKNRETHQNMV